MTAQDSVGFPRPGLTGYGNLLATLLFAITGGLYFLSGRNGFGIGWWLIGAFWLRRYFWARKTPMLELTRQKFLMHVAPRRVRPLPLADIVSVQHEGDAVVLELKDQSVVTYSGFDLRKDDMSAFYRLLEERRRGLVPEDTAEPSNTDG